MNKFEEEMLKNVLDADKREPMDYYGLAMVLESAAKLVNEIPNKILRQVEPEVSEAVCELESAAKKVIGYTTQLDKVIEEEEKKLFQQLDDHYNNVKKMANNINEKFSKLPKIDENVRIPYNVKELVQVAESIERLSPEAFERLAKLCEIFASK
jgi:predicted transcriptional regulator